MKKTISAIFMFLLLSSGIVHADVFKVLSQEYHIEGFVSLYDPYTGSWPERYFDSYQATSSSPVHQGVNAMTDNHWDWAYAESWASGGTETTSVWVGSGADIDGSGQMAASASAYITFRPYVTTAQLNFGGVFSEAMLIDLTTGSILYALTEDAWNSDNFFTVALDLTHTYMIKSETEGHVGSSISLQSVPEPATLLLIGFGLVGLAGMKRKFRK